MNTNERLFFCVFVYKRARFTMCIFIATQQSIMDLTNWGRSILHLAQFLVHFCEAIDGDRQQLLRRQQQQHKEETQSVVEELQRQHHQRHQHDCHGEAMRGEKNRTVANARVRQGGNIPASVGRETRAETLHRTRFKKYRQSLVSSFFHRL